MVLAIEDRGTTFWCTICFRNILEFKFCADLMFPLQTFSLLLTLNFLFAHLTLMQLCASHNILNLFQICIFKLLCSSTSWWRQYTSKVFELWHLFTYAACAHSLPTYTSIFLLAQLLPTLFLHIFSAKKNCSPPQKRTGTQLMVTSPFQSNILA